MLLEVESCTYIISSKVGSLILGALKPILARNHPLNNAINIDDNFLESCLQRTIGSEHGWLPY